MIDERVTAIRGILVPLLDVRLTEKPSADVVFVVQSFRIDTGPVTKDRYWPLASIPVPQAANDRPYARFEIERRDVDDVQELRTSKLAASEALDRRQIRIEHIGEHTALLPGDPSNNTRDGPISREWNPEHRPFRDQMSAPHAPPPFRRAPTLSQTGALAERSCALRGGRQAAPPVNEPTAPYWPPPACSMSSSIGRTASAQACVESSSAHLIMMRPSPGAVKTKLAPLLGRIIMP